MLKSKCKINAASRTVQKYMNLLGWRKIKKKTCAFVSIKNRIERLIFARFARTMNDEFNESIFIGNKVKLQLILSNDLVLTELRMKCNFKF